MHDEKKYFENYADNINLLKSVEISASIRAKVWRNQTILLHRLTRTFDNATYCTIMTDHYDRLNGDLPNMKYLGECAINVRKLLQKRNDSNNLKSVEFYTKFPRLKDEYCESENCGSFENCKIYIITDFSLKRSLKTPDHSNTIVKISSDDHKTSLNFLQNQLKKKINPGYPKVGAKYIPPNNAQVIGDKCNENGFNTARDEMGLQSLMNNKSMKPLSYGAVRGQRDVWTKYITQMPKRHNEDTKEVTINTTNLANKKRILDLYSPVLSNIDQKFVDIIKSEIMHKFKPIGWGDIAGLDYVKSIIMESVVYPILRPDIFTGLRRPPRGILLFGPPGTGKTLIGRCIASLSNSTFFSINPSTLTSKWVGDGEKLVKTLFSVAMEHQPAVIFLDEIDSLLSQRCENEHESTRRLKNEFLIQLDGASTSEEERILIIGATNRPKELDEAARRRFVRRLYIPLPNLSARKHILSNLLQTIQNSLNEVEITQIAELTEGYSGADIDSLCREAAMEPIRSIPPDEISEFDAKNVRPISMKDFYAALKNVVPSVSQEDLKQYIEWNNIYGAQGCF